MKIFYYFLLIIGLTKLFLNKSFAQDSLYVSFPNGISTHLMLENAGILPKELQQRFPLIKAFKARNKNFPKSDFRIQYFRDNWEIYQLDGDQITKLIKNKDGIWEHEILDEFNEKINCVVKPVNKENDLSKNYYTLPDDTLRIYRLALSATGEFSSFYGGDVQKVLSVLVGMVNLVNAVFERDLGVRFTLVNQTDDLIFQYANADPFTLGNESAQNQALLDRLIGNDSYDIGHVLGGLKSVSIGKIGSICQQGEKGLGVSSSLIPEGISFVFDYFSHELAHQLGGNHTFNSLICNNQRNAKTAWEPGSGISILGYPGLCASDNLSQHVLPHFHSGSIEEIGNMLISKNYRNCGEKLPLRRSHQGHVELKNVYIPRNTPFLLAPEMDNFGDWFSWESIDLGVASNLNEIKGNSPNIPVTTLKTKALRSFPIIDSLLKSTFEPGVILPDYERTINLRLTRRDSLKIDWHSFSLKVNPNVGPFMVNLPKEDLVNSGDSPVLVEWDPANTFLPPVDADKVDVFLVDIFNPDTLIYLQRNIPNIGRISVYLPLHLPSSTYKIGIIGTNKLFFNLSKGKINFQKKNNLVLNPIFKFPLFNCGIKTEFYWDLSSLPIHFFPLTLKLKDIPGWKFSWNEKVFLKPELIIWDVIGLTNVQEPQLNSAILQVISTNMDYQFPIEWMVFPKNEMAIENITPIQHAEVFELNPVFTWKSSEKVDWYQMEISDNNRFNFLLDSIVTLERTTFSNIRFEPGKTYYWRVKYNNILCGSGYSEIFSFKVAGSICKVWKSNDSLRLNQIPFRQSNLIIDQKGSLTEISEIWVNLKVTNWESLKIFIKSPSGKRIPLNFPANCLKMLQWQYLKFTQSKDESPCLTGDTLLIPNFNLFMDLKGESLYGLWQLIFEGVNQSGTIGDWGLKGCYLEKVTGTDNNQMAIKAFSFIFPNPSNENSPTIIFYKTEEAKVILWDIYGKKIGEWKKESGFDRMDISNLNISKGVYFWELDYKNKDKEILKWILH